jgi:hypothetical protein
MTKPDSIEVVRGFVAEVVSDREVILNRGSQQGVQEGQYFAILDPDTIEVTDPETGDDLGGIKVVKIVVRAVEVAPKLTLARTFRTKTVNIGGTGVGAITGFRAAFAGMEPPEMVEQVERLTINKNAPRKIDPSDSIVLRGDPFEQISEAEVEDVKSITVWK